MDTEAEKLTTARTGYQVAVSLATMHGQLAWQVSSVMMVANSILVAGFALLFVNAPGFKLLLLALPAAGILLCLAWLLLTARNFDAFSHFVLSARTLEENYLQPLAALQEGAKLGKGDRVFYQAPSGTDCLHPNPLSRFRGRVVFRWVIAGFVALYAIALWQATAAQPSGRVVNGSTSLAQVTTLTPTPPDLTPTAQATAQLIDLNNAHDWFLVIVGAALTAFLTATAAFANWRATAGAAQTQRDISAQTIEAQKELARITADEDFRVRRALARDDALLRWRIEAVQPLLEIANSKQGVVHEILAEMNFLTNEQRQDRQRLHEIAARLNDQEEFAHLARVKPLIDDREMEQSLDEYLSFRQSFAQRLDTWFRGGFIELEEYKRWIDAHTAALGKLNASAVRFMHKLD